MAEYDPNELLLPSLLAMDVYHRDVRGGLSSKVDNLPYIDGAQPFSDFDEKKDIGFFAKAYVKDGTTYIAYRGTDDGSLNFGTNYAKIASQLSTPGGDAPFRDLYYGYTGAVGSLSQRS
jgi:hypothetical protein